MIFVSVLPTQILPDFVSKNWLTNENINYIIVFP